MHQEANLLNLARVYHRLFISLREPVAVLIAKTLLHIQNHLFQLYNVLAAVLQLRLEHPFSVVAAVCTGLQGAYLCPHNKRRLAYELI